MTDRASLLWASTTTATLPTDASFNTVRTTKNTTTDITGYTDKSVSLVCDGHCSVQGTIWANRVRGNTGTTCDPRAKAAITQLTGNEDESKNTHFLPGIREMNVWTFHYKTDSPDQMMLGPMTDETLLQFPKIVDVPDVSEDDEHIPYNGINLCGYTTICLGGIKDLDETQQKLSAQVEKLMETQQLLSTQVEELMEMNKRLINTINKQAIEQVSDNTPIYNCEPVIYYSNAY